MVWPPAGFGFSHDGGYRVSTWLGPARAGGDS